MNFTLAKRCLIIAGLSILSITARASAAVLNTAQLIRWGCPVNLGASPPQPDTDGSRLLLHVTDNAGNDFEIRCVKGFTGFHYEYSISFANGTEEVISECIYPQGLNDAELIYQGPMSQVTSPTGTPVINVGTILIVEHSNKQATGNAASGLTPKPGGEDFDMVYDYRQRFRYRLNTKNGKGVTGTDYFESRAWSPFSSILQADATLLSSPADFKRALADDMDFRRSDYPQAEPPCEKCDTQEADTDDNPIGYTYLSEGERSGGLLFDPGLRGSRFAFQSDGVSAHVPPMDDRTRSTFALARRLFKNDGNLLAVLVDRRAARDIHIRSGKTMVVIDLPLDQARHVLLITERVRKGSRSYSRSKRGQTK